MTTCMMGGGGDPRITLSNVTVPATAIDPSDATAGYSLENDGDIIRNINGSTTDLGDWIAPKSSTLAANYEVFATLNSGSVSSGTTGSWLGLESIRSWTRTQTSLGASTAVLGIQIRRKGSTTAVASCIVTLSAQVD